MATVAAPAHSTRDNLLSAAERLFARVGIEKASLRAITQEAGANLAAVHYHFGSKEALVRSVFTSRLEPLNRERLELLSECEKSSEGSPEIEAIVHAFVAPTLRMMQRESQGQDFARLMVRSFTEAGEGVRALILEQLREVIRRFTAAMGRSLPHLPREEIYWRFHFMIGAMVYAAGLGFVLEHYSEGLCDPGDADGVTRRLVSFVAAGMRQGVESKEGKAS